MASVQVNGPGLWVPSFTQFAPVSGSIGSTIDATGEKIAFIGRVWTPNRGTKSIRNVSFRFATVTKAGGSGLTVSLQDVSLTGGPPLSPDETQDETVAIANGDANFASSTYYTTGNLSADRSVSFGSLLAVVIEFDGSGRLGADSVGVTVGMNAVSATIRSTVMGVSLKASGTWTDQAALPNILFTFSDGTYGTLLNCLPFSSTTVTQAYNSGSAADERALEFQLPFDCKVEGYWAFASIASGADFDVVLYDASSSVLDSTTVDANAIYQAGASNPLQVLGTAEITLSKNTTYRLSLKPTTANSITISELTVADANHLAVYPGGTAFRLATRVDAGAWTTVTTQRPFYGLIVSSVDDGTGAGGGGGGGPLVGGRLAI